MMFGGILRMLGLSSKSQYTSSIMTEGGDVRLPDQPRVGPFKLINEIYIEHEAMPGVPMAIADQANININGETLQRLPDGTFLIRARKGKTYSVARRDGHWYRIG